MEIYENLDLNDLDEEIWKQICGFDGDYYISNLGRIKSFKRYGGTDVRILEQIENKDRYLFVNLYKNGKTKLKYIHILLHSTFNNYKLKKNECIHHIDFTKNNFLKNLQVISKSEHSKIHNKNKIVSEETKNKQSEKKKGENAPNSTLTEQDIILIKIDLCGGLLTQREIAKKFGVDKSTISSIKTGKTWKE